MKDNAQKKPPFDTQDKRDDATCAKRTGPKTKERAKAMRRPPFDQSYLNPDGPKSALVSGVGLEQDQWMDPIGTIHDDSDDPLTAYE